MSTPHPWAVLRLIPELCMVLLNPKLCYASSLNSATPHPGTLLQLTVKGTVSRDFLLLVFFINQFPPSPRVFHLDRFEFFRKFAEIFADQGWPPVSTTPVANFATSFTSVVDTGGKQWEQYQAADTSKWTWRQKFIYMLSLLSKGVPTKLLKFFWLKIFFICHRWSTTPVVNLELRISPRIFEKIRNGPNRTLWGWGETDS